MLFSYNYMFDFLGVEDNFFGFFPPNEQSGLMFPVKPEHLFPTLRSLPDFPNPAPEWADAIPDGDGTGI